MAIFIMNEKVKKLKKLKFLLFSIILFAVISGCSSTKETAKKINKIIGMSAVVGNEPFTHIAIIVYPHNVYIVKGTEAVRKLLSDNQGKYVQIKYSEIKDSASVYVVNALSAKVL
jgi:hypothetical protein